MKFLNTVKTTYEKPRIKCLSFHAKKRFTLIW